MTDVVVPLWGQVDSLRRRAATQRAMAKARWLEAVRCLETGDRDGYFSRLRDTDAHEEEARRLESQADGIELARVETAAAIAGVLRRAAT